MDPFEEFEFKPLTEGLGFHQKRASLKESTEKSALVEAKLNKVIPEAPSSALFDERPTPSMHKSQTSYTDLLKALEKPLPTFAEGDKAGSSSLEITTPLPRSGSRSGFDIEPRQEIPSPVPPLQRAPTTPPIASSLPNKTFVEESSKVGARRGAADNPMGGWEPTPTSFRSAILDFVVILAMSLVFLVSLLMVTGVPLTTVVRNVQADFTTQISMLLLFVAVMQMYVVLSRSFFGRTLGEWTFEVQLGRDEQHRSAYYPLLVVIRSLVIVATGILPLPLLSFLVRKDLAGKISGLQLYRQRGNS